MNTKDRIFVIILSFISFFIFFRISLVPYFIGLGFIFWIYRKDYLKLNSNIINPLHYIPLLFYFLIIVGLVYSSNLKYGVKDIETKISLFLFALLLIDSGFLKRNFRIIANAFILSGLVLNIVLLIYAYKNCLHIVDGKEIFNISAQYPAYITSTFVEHLRIGSSYFTGGFLFERNPILDNKITLHHSYVAMYVLMAVCFSFYFMVNAKKVIEKIANAFISVFFLGMIILLCSRAGYVAALVVLLVLFVYLVYLKNKYLLFKILFPVLVLFFAGDLIYLLKQTRLQNNLGANKTELVENLKKDDRVKLWATSIELIKENKWLGVGTGDIMDELNKNYEKENLPKGFNSHNQYLQTWATLGMPGLLVLLLMLGLPFYYAIKRRSILMLCFILIISINLLFESMFERLFGIMFFAFFYYLLLPTIISEKRSREVDE